MIRGNETSNAQSWELEVTCKNKKYLDAVVAAILQHGLINFEVELIDINNSHNEEFCARYTVFMWSSWFKNLAAIAKELKKIENKHGD